MMKKIAFRLFAGTMFIASLLIGSGVIGKNNGSISYLDNWEIVEPPPKRDEKERLMWKEDTGMSSIHWEVHSYSGGNVIASPFSYPKEESKSPCVNFVFPKKFRTERSNTGDLGWPEYYERKTNYYKVHDGWMVGFFNRFNGELWWCSNSNGISYKVSNSKVIDIVNGFKDSEIYVINGSFNDENPLTGRVDHIVYRKNGIWEEKGSIIFPSRLAMGKRLGDRLYFIGKDGSLYVVDDTYSVEEKVHSDDWHVVHPTSMIKVDTYIYVGSRKYVTRIDLTSWEVTYFYPK